MLYDESATNAPEALPGRPLVSAGWLLRLRWVAVAGQLLTIGIVAFVYRFQLPWWPLLGVVAFTAASNLLLAWLWRGPTDQRITAAAQAHRSIGLVMALDLLSLTVLLYFSGGPNNPFALFYLVNLALSAVLLPRRWAWGLAATATVCFAALFVDHVPLPDLAGRNGNPAADLRSGVTQQGLLVAMAASAGVIVYFITRVRGQLRRREEELRVAGQRRASGERLEALATLAAGAGHELASPLSTIAVVAKDLTQHLKGTDVPQEVIDDVALIRSELDHCRTILDRLAGAAGQAVGAEVVPVRIEDLARQVLEGLRRRGRVELSIADDARQMAVLAPPEGLAQAVRGVVQNALDASRPDQNVQLAAVTENGHICLTVSDRGTGMSTDVLARAGEPFFTTKDPGQGMGLGLFLTRSVVERLGGTLKIQSVARHGTSVIIRLPAVSRPVTEVPGEIESSGGPFDS